MINRKLIYVVICVGLVPVVVLAATWLYKFAVNKYNEKMYPLPDEYLEMISKYSDRYSVPEALICGVINTESSFVYDAVSHAGAKGLMQITDPTFEWIQYRLGEEVSIDMVFDAETNIKYGTFLLSFLYEEFGNWDTAFAAYNAGRNKVKSWLQDETITKDGKLVNIPYGETAIYIKKVNKAWDYYSKNYFNK